MAKLGEVSNELNKDDYETDYASAMQEAINEQLKSNPYVDTGSSFEKYIKSRAQSIDGPSQIRDGNFQGSKVAKYNIDKAKSDVDKFVDDYKKMLQPIVQDIQANADAASTAETSAINDAIQARKAGINAGMGKARAGLLGDALSNTNTSNVYNNAYSASIQNQGSTQADYLQKMGQATAAECQAKNMQNGAILNTIGGTMQGAGQGASLGASLSAGSTGGK